MRRLTTVLALVCVVLAAPSAAVAVGATSSTPSQAISDCYAHSRLTAHYSTDTLRKALVQMPADIREYSDCYDVIEKQLFVQEGSNSSGGSGTPVSGSGSSGSVIPTALLIVVVLLALAAVTFGALAIRRQRGEGPNDPGPGGPGGPGGSGPETGA